MARRPGRLNALLDLIHLVTVFAAMADEQLHRGPSLRSEATNRSELW